MPLPFFVNVPLVPVPIMLAMLLAAFVPSRVNPRSRPVIVPAFEMTMFPLFATMLLELPA